MKHKLAAFLVIFSTAAQADTCLEMYSLSKTIQTNIADKEFFEKQSSEFCKEYSKSKNNSNGFDYDLGYEILSVSAGSSNKNAERISNNFCSSKDRSKLSNNAYKKYIETISPDAHKSYKQCIDAYKHGVKFGIKGQTDSQFGLLASYTDYFKNEANLVYKASDGISIWAISLIRLLL